KPGVSTNTNWVSPIVSTPRTVSRVVWGCRLVMAMGSPRSALRRVLLPTLGRPMSATRPERTGPGSTPLAASSGSDGAGGAGGDGAGGARGAGGMGRGCERGLLMAESRVVCARARLQLASAGPVAHVAPLASPRPRHPGVPANADSACSRRAGVAPRQTLEV